MADSQILDTVSAAHEPWENRSKDIYYRPAIRFAPRSVSQIRNIVMCAEMHKPSMKLKAVGSGWAYEPIAVTESYLIETHALNRILFTVTDNGPYSEEVTSLVPLKEDALDRLDSMDPNDPLNGKRGLSYVQGGIKIDDLYLQLHDLGMGIPTMGGSSGQSLAGAISTGTHGGDVSRPPLADWVQAIHLVGSGGREYWIERLGKRSMTDSDGWKETGTWNDNMQIIYDDTIFYATLVSAGRMGVVYAFLFQVVDLYYLKEIRDAQPWDSISELINKLTPSQLYDHFAFDDKPLHFLQLLLSLGWDNHCHITRRVVTSDYKRMPKHNFDALAIAEDIFANPEAVWQFAKLGITSHGHALQVIFDTEALPAVVDGMDPGQKRWWGNFLINGAQTGHVAQGAYFYIMDGTYGGSGLTMPPDDTLEYAFDASKNEYLRFVNEVMVMANSPQMNGYISLRYTLASEATLAMQMFEHTVSIEVAVLKNVSGNPQFMAYTHKTAKGLGGVPHWGLDNNATAREIEEFYGSRLRLWRHTARYLTKFGIRDTFQNQYTREKGLEPLNPGADNLLLMSAAN